MNYFHQEMARLQILTAATIKDELPRKLHLLQNEAAVLAFKLQ
jgi:hypothetical protein